MKKIILTISVVTAANVLLAQTNFNQYSSGSALLNNYGNATGGGAVINSLANHENTKGTRFMFNGWLKGTVTDSKGEVINDDSLRYNFDKQADNLILTKDNINIVSVPPSQIKKFTLISNGKIYQFERLNSIDSSKLLLSLDDSDGKYKLYKYVKTEFIKSDYHTNGIMQSGNEYDEYLDHVLYYLTEQGKPGYKTIELKLKSIKNAFSENKSKLYDFMGQEIDNPVDENYLVNLVHFMNN